MSAYGNTPSLSPGQLVQAKWNPTSNKFKEAVVLGIVIQSPQQPPNLILRFSGFPDFKEIPFIPERVHLGKKLSEPEIQKNIHNLALMILNKISGTKTETFQKQVYNNLPKFRFLEILIQNDNPEICLKISQVILKKSQLEPGFNDLYTNLVVHLSSVNPIFKSVFQQFMSQLLQREDIQISEDDKQEYFSFLQFSGKLYLQEIISILDINQQLLTLFDKKIPEGEVYIEAVLKLMTIVTPKFKKLDDKHLFFLITNAIRNFSKGEGHPLSNRMRFLCLNYLDKNKLKTKSIRVQRK